MVSDMPSEDRDFTPKEFLRVVSDKLNYSAWTLPEASEYDIVALTRTVGANHWPKHLTIMVSDLVEPSFVTNDGADAIDGPLTRTFAALEAEPPVRGQRASGSDLSSSSSSGSRPTLGTSIRSTGPLGTRSATLERELFRGGWCLGRR